VYGGFTTKLNTGHNISPNYPARDFLCGKINIEPNPIPAAKTVDEICEWWKTRWAKQRYTHLSNTKRIRTLHHDTASAADGNIPA